MTWYRDCRRLWYGVKSHQGHVSPAFKSSFHRSKLHHHNYMIERLSGRVFHKEAVSTLLQSIPLYKHLHWHPAPSLTKTFSSFELISLTQNLLGFLTWESHECTKWDLHKCCVNVKSSASSAGSPGFGSPLVRNPPAAINEQSLSEYLEEHDETYNTH